MFVSEETKKRVNIRNSKQMKKIVTKFRISSKRGSMEWQYHPLFHETKEYTDCPRSFVIEKKCNA